MFNKTESQASEDLSGCVFVYIFEEKYFCPDFESQENKASKHVFFKQM